MATTHQRTDAVRPMSADARQRLAFADAGLVLGSTPSGARRTSSRTVSSPPSEACSSISFGQRKVTAARPPRTSPRQRPDSSSWKQSAMALEWQLSRPLQRQLLSVLRNWPQKGPVRIGPEGALEAVTAERDRLLSQFEAARG